MISDCSASPVFSSMLLVFWFGVFAPRLLDYIREIDLLNSSALSVSWLNVSLLMTGGRFVFPISSMVVLFLFSDFFLITLITFSLSGSKDGDLSILPLLSSLIYWSLLFSLFCYFWPGWVPVEFTMFLFCEYGYYGRLLFWTATPKLFNLGSSFKEDPLWLFLIF